LNNEIKKLQEKCTINISKTSATILEIFKISIDLDLVVFSRGQLASRLSKLKEQESLYRRQLEELKNREKITKQKFEYEKTKCKQLKEEAEKNMQNNRSN